MSADNPVKLRRQTEQLLYSEACLDYLGIAESGEPLEVTTSGGSFTVEALPMEGFGDAALSSLSQQRESTPATAYRKGTYYFAQSLDDTTYYIQFNQCMEDPKQPMDGFAAQVEAELEAETTARCCWISATTAAAPTACWSPSLCWCPAWWRRA